MEIIVENGGTQGIANYSALVSSVNEQLSTYRGMIVLEENIPSAKTTVAELRRMAKAASDYRITIKREHEAKISETISQLKEITDLYNQAADSIDGQIKEYEQKAQQDKKTEIEAFFVNTAGKMAPYISINTIWNPRWLNKSYSLDAIKDEIITAINNAISGMRSIMAMKSPHEAALLRTFFTTLSLEKALEQKVQLDEQQEQMQKQMEGNAANIPSQMPQESVSAVQGTTELPKMENPVQTDFQRYTLRFEVVATKPQIVSLREFLMANDIKYKKI